MNNTKKTAFSTIIYNRGKIPNLTLALMTFLYEGLFLFMRPHQFPWAGIICAVIVLFAEFVFSPLTNPILTKKLTEDLQDFEDGKIQDEESRTSLFLRLARFPALKALQTFLYFMICAVALMLGYHLAPQMAIGWSVAVVAFIACSFGGLMAAIVTLDYSEDIVSTYCKKLVQLGISTSSHKRKTFGIPLAARCVLYLVIPVIYLSCITYLLGWQMYDKDVQIADVPYQIFILRNIIVHIINLTLYVWLCLIYYKKLQGKAVTIGNTMERVVGKTADNNYIETDLFDQQQYSIHLLNGIVQNFSGIINKALETSRNVQETMQTLSITAGQLNSTSIEQDSEVREITATMQDTNASLQNIVKKLQAVSDGSATTNDYVESGYKSLKQNAAQMNHIHDSNNAITQGIENLSKQVDNIDSVIATINEIAEETKIIAFNADIEAVNAGERGRNFHIIATEIRRLAINIMESIKETQSHITEIKNSATDLVHASTQTSQLIAKGQDLTDKLGKHFTGIRNAAESTASKAADITEITNQQSNSFNQIVITLTQISASIRSFTDSTKQISEVTARIKEIADGLNSITA